MVCAWDRACVQAVQGQGRVELRGVCLGLPLIRLKSQQQHRLWRQAAAAACWQGAACPPACWSMSTKPVFLGSCWSLDSLVQQKPCMLLTVQLACLSAGSGGGQ